ncbi:MAG: type I glyceraldehyde-3-phosphate dehydrogenase [Cyanobacteria bacterium QS_8_64_29]|nr:MAG: type I glyceraldehyde-3-phosphate dehydrogenase [Cyanobacteria bacterium QS_8_64_29]
MIRVAINGFGRIGRNFLRCWLQRQNSQVQIVAINDTSDPKTNAHLLKYDTTFGELKADVSASEDALTVGGNTIKCVSDRDPVNLPWDSLGVDLVVESTGIFTTKEKASKHLAAGANKVLLTAPGKGGGIPTYLVGVNENSYRHDDGNEVISNASCTTNCLAPIAKVLHEEFGIVQGTMTTTHSYTGDQRLLDASHKDLRRARAAANNIVPTTTGAAEAVALVVPELEGKLNGVAMRVPTPNVSVVDFVAQVEKPTIPDQVNEVLKAASENSMRGIIEYSDEPLVSSDYCGHDASSIVDASLTMVLGGNMVKVISWYDNEWGYSQRVLDLAEVVADKWPA